MSAGGGCETVKHPIDEVVEIYSHADKNRNQGTKPTDKDY